MDDNTRLEDLEQLYQAAKAWRRNLPDVLGSVKLSDGVESLMARSEHTVSTFEALRDTIDRLMGKEGNMFIGGVSGGGMSYAFKRYMLKRYMLNDNFIIDPKKEYQPTEIVDGDEQSE